MERNFIFKDLFITTNKAKRVLDKFHRLEGIYIGQARILRYIYQHQNIEIYQADVEKTLDIRGASVSQLIDSLVENEYLLRKDEENDRRKKKLILTRAGIKKAEEALVIVGKFENQIIKKLSQREIQDLKETLSKINQVLDELEKE